MKTMWAIFSVVGQKALASLSLFWLDGPHMCAVDTPVSTTGKGRYSLAFRAGCASGFCVRYSAKLVRPYSPSARDGPTLQEYRVTLRRRRAPLHLLPHGKRPTDRAKPCGFPSLLREGVLLCSPSARRKFRQCRRHTVTLRRHQVPLTDSRTVAEEVDYGQIWRVSCWLQH
jgi:hypothetical protein